MNTALGYIACVLMLNLVAGLIRVYRGPAAVDRLLTLQLMGTSGIAILIVLSAKQRMPALIDAALILALLAAVTLLAFVCRIWQRMRDHSPREGDA